MILPTKKLRGDTCLVYLGSILLRILDEPKTVSRAWEEFQRKRIEDQKVSSCDVSFDWFILALDFLNIVDAIDLRNGRLERKR